MSAGARAARRMGAGATAFALAPTAALAHAAEAAGGWSAALLWTLAPLLLGAGLYVLGLLRLWGRAGFGRGAPPGRVASMAAGLLGAAFALFSPLDRLAGDLFSAHMVQHVLLMLVAAPLMVLGRPAPVFLWAFPRPARPAVGGLGGGWTGGLWRALTTPFGGWAAFLLVLWTWHVPALYERALVHEAVHALQHLSFTGGAILFWTAVLERARGAERGAALLAIFATAVQSCALGALLTVTSLVWYPIYAGRAAAWGLTPLEDQQLGGLVMWIPSGAILIGAALAVLAALLRDAEARAEAPA